MLDALTELQHQLRLVAGAREDRADERRNALERLDQDLDQLLNLQSEVTELAGPDPQGAAAKEQQVAESLADAGQPAPLPEGIQEEFSQAQQAVAAAQAAFQETAAAEASTRQQAAQEAAEALGELAAEVKASLDETPSSQQSDQEAEAGNSSETSASGEPPTAQSGQARQQQEDGAQSTQGTGQTASSQPADGRSASSLTDIAAPPRNIAGEAWFLKLPAEVREAMRASTRLRPPPGYEERLRRYFKSLD